MKQTHWITFTLCLTLCLSLVRSAEEQVPSNPLSYAGLPGIWYRIRSSKNTVLDNWGGKIGDNSAALQPDDTPDSENRKWELLPAGTDRTSGLALYKIRSAAGTVLDHNGGKIGESTATLHPDDGYDQDSRKWMFVPIGDGWFRIKSLVDTVLDDWAGKRGEDSAAFMKDDDPTGGNRRWQLVPINSLQNSDGVWYKIRSIRGTVLNDWGGTVGENTAAYSSDMLTEENLKFQLISVGNGWFRIRSTKGTVLDSWGGKTGANSAAFQPDDVPTSDNRKFRFISVGGGYYGIVSVQNTILDDWAGATGPNSAAFQPNNDGTYWNRKFQLVPTAAERPRVGVWYRISSTKGTVLDSWGGKTGEDSASLQPDNSPNSDNRKFQLVPTSDSGWYRIRSPQNTVLDDWGGKTDRNSLALMPDDSPDSLNRRWRLVALGRGWYRIVSTKWTCIDDWGGATGENSASLMPDDTPESGNRMWKFIPVDDAVVV